MNPQVAHKQEADQKTGYSEEGRTMFLLKRREIRRSLKSLARQQVKVKQQRFRRNGARKNLFERRGQISALLDVYALLREDHAGEKHGFNQHTKKFYTKWYTLYYRMYIV